MATSNASPNAGVLPGKISPDEPAHTLPAEPANIMPPIINPGNEEPELLLEPDLPSDGRDAEGEAMIRDMPQRPELSEPPSQPSPSGIKP